MYKSILAASIAVLTAASNLEEIDDLNRLNDRAESRLAEYQEAADETETNLTMALIREIARLNEDLDLFMSQVDILNSKTIVEDYFFSNTETMYCPKSPEYLCHDLAEAGPGETFEFDANITLDWAITPEHAVIYMYLFKNDDE